MLIYYSKSFQNNPNSFFYGSRRLLALETVVDPVVFDVNKTFNDLNNLRLVLHLKYVKEVVIDGSHIYLLKVQTQVSMSLYAKNTKRLMVW